MHLLYDCKVRYLIEQHGKTKMRKLFLVQGVVVLTATGQ